MGAIRLGLIGLGAWAREAYVPVLKELADVDVCAVAAKSEATRTFAREQFGDDIALYDNYAALLQDKNVEAVTVALPNALHVEATRAAVASGKHVFYEPPIGHTAEEIECTLEAMRASQAVIQADLELRYLPVMDFVRELLVSNAIGEAIMARVRLWTDWGYGGGNWNQNPEDEGFFPWLGCWYLDALDCVFAAPPVRASVVGGCAMNGRLTDHGWAALEYGDGRIGQFEFNLVAVEGLDIGLTVLGTQGEIEADLAGGTCRWRGKDAAWQEETRAVSEPIHGFAGMRECITDFLAAIRQGRSERADADVTSRVHHAMRVCAEAELGPD